MQLVDDRQMGVQAVQRAPFRALRLEGAVGAGNIQRVREDLEPELALERLAHPRHFLGISPDNLRLVPGRRKAVDLGARLPVSQQAVEPDAGEQRALAVASRHLDIGPPEPPVPVMALPPEHSRENEDLPRLEPDLLSAELPLRVGQELDKTADPAGLGLVEEEGALPRRVAPQILDLPLACQLHPLACGYPSLEDIGAVLLGDPAILSIRSLQSRCPSREHQARGPVRDWRG